MLANNTDLNTIESPGTYICAEPKEVAPTLETDERIIAMAQACSNLNVELLKVQAENKKLKELLRQAMNDLDKQGCENHCSTCMYGGNFNVPFCNRDRFKWKHTTEAEEILKGDETE